MKSNETEHSYVVNFATFCSRNLPVLYPSLRVSLPEGKEQIVGNLPPGSTRPSSMQALHLQIDGHLSPNLTAEGDRLPEFAAQFAIGALEQRGGTDPFPCDGIEA